MPNNSRQVVDRSAHDDLAVFRKHASHRIEQTRRGCLVDLGIQPVDASICGRVGAADQAPEALANHDRACGGRRETGAARRRET